VTVAVVDGAHYEKQRESGHPHHRRILFATSNKDEHGHGIMWLAQLAAMAWLLVEYTVEWLPGST
jgi:hypothetical protein